jgi:mono/diheme cytochrome c family protein
MNHALFFLLAACHFGRHDHGDDSDGPSDDSGRPDDSGTTDDSGDDSGTVKYDGQEVFRHDTFGDEVFWTDVLHMNEVVQTIDPTTALAVGLKVDASVVPKEVLATADLKDPATTAALLSLGAVVGIEAEVDDAGTITRLGVTCALCHSTVDDSVLPGVGVRLDGHPNRSLDPGLIISLSPYWDDKPDLRKELQSWGPGFYDPYWNHDGISDPVVIPPAYGLADVALETYTGEGPVSYWNAYVAVTQMGGQGTFVSKELGIDIEHEPDLVTPKLPALRDYQFSLTAPTADPKSFDAKAADRGAKLFTGVARCAECHTGDSFTDAPKLHDPKEVGQDPTYATRATTGLYRTTPLRGLSGHPPYFHDGSAATLEEVVMHYDSTFSLGLKTDQSADLVAYLQSL